MQFRQIHVSLTGVPSSAGRSHRLAPAAILAASLAATSVALAQGSFQGLGDLPGGRGSHAGAVSADGSVVVGFSYDIAATPHAFRWTQANGMHALFEGGLDFTSSALGISADGLTIGGWNAPTIVEEKAFFWSVATGEQTLATRSGVMAISGTGAVGAGYVVHGRGAPQRAAIWDSNRSETFIDSPGTIPTSDARGISADGSVVVGQAVFGTSMIRAFHWTAATGMQNIGSPDSGGPSSHADAITPDGSVVVGAVASPQQAVSWTAAGGMRFLGALPGALDSAAYAVSEDGATIVGVSGGRAFVWRQGTGIEDLQTLLAPPVGWTLTEARGISADGTIIVGNGSLGAWIATLPCLTTVPEVDNSLVVTGAPTSTISWGRIGGRFNVYRGSVSGAWSYNQTCFDPNTAGPSTDPTVPPPDTFLFYAVSRRDACGHESVVGRDSAGAPIPNSASCP